MSNDVAPQSATYLVQSGFNRFHGTIVAAEGSALTVRDLEGRLHSVTSANLLSVVKGA